MLSIKVHNFIIRCIAKFIRSKVIRRKFVDFFMDNRDHQYYNHAYDMGENIGRHSYMGEGCCVYDPNTKIGSFCTIAHNVLIGAGQHPLNFLSVHPFQYSNNFVKHKKNIDKPFLSYSPVEVGNDVWIGSNVVIMDRIRIGDGAVIGSNAVVTKDIPPYAIAVGIPAKVVRYRFDQEIINELLQIKWWRFDDSQLAGLPFDDIESCINQLRKINGEIEFKSK